MFPSNQTLPDPASLKLVLYPHETLLVKAEPVQLVDGKFADPVSVSAYALRLERVMLSLGDRAIGLAANQIGLLLRMFACLDDLNDKTKKRRTSQVYINPEVVANEGELLPYEEGCMSFPNIRGKVSRKKLVTLRYLTPAGETREVSSDGLQARCWLHEIDHLNAVNIIDHFSAADLRRNKLSIDRLRKRG